MASTKEVLEKHLKCFDEGDLKGILSDYAPGAVLFTSDGPLRGAYLGVHYSTVSRRLKESEASS
jgi:hypothetical protein